MKELLEIIAKRLVDNPNQVTVTETITERGSTLELRVAEDDMGKVIGKSGKIAKSIRTVVRAAAIHNNKHVMVEIIQQA
jgi:predicted RNA-binding protein YlqC (UPF0109 family)